MRDRSSSDVLIVGAGPAGCAAGIELRRKGYDVCVLDAARFPRDKVCGDAVSSAGMRELEALDAGAAVRAAPHALVRSAAAVFPDGARIERRYDPPGSIVPRFELDDCLRRSLEAHGARLVQNTRVTSLLQQDGRFSGAITEHTHFAAKLIIACDGYGSVALRALAEKSPRGAGLGVSITAYYRNVRFPNGPDVSDHYFECELPYGYGWIFPAVNGVANVGVYMRADAYARAGKKLGALLDGFIARHSERMADAELVAPRRSWSLPLAPHKLPLTAAGMILAGDAASLVDPLSGEGIWQALHSGRLAGQIAARALQAGSLTPGLANEYRSACERSILRPSRYKAWVQTGMDRVMSLGLYRSRQLQAVLRWGYENKALDLTKS